MTERVPSAIPDLSAREMAKLIRDGELSVREAVQSHFDQIDLINPSINAIILQDREGAFQAAERADELTAAGGELPPAAWRTHDPQRHEQHQGHAHHSGLGRIKGLRS
ncbi:hypothetical protein [Salinibacterium sp. M195]|uniref:hypothetical protein n=1 Tax=Salinibacterium sp. M195 TaxID=2583374 RepID=UPI00351D86C6